MLLDLHIFEDSKDNKRGACDFEFSPEKMSPLMFACA